MKWAGFLQLKTLFKDFRVQLISGIIKGKTSTIFSALIFLKLNNKIIK
jgi:hypothetical protein